MTESIDKKSDICSIIDQFEEKIQHAHSLLLAKAAEINILKQTLADAQKSTDSHVFQVDVLSEEIVDTHIVDDKQQSLKFQDPEMSNAANPTNPTKQDTNRQVLSDLCERFPKAFNLTTPVPLKIGIHKEVLNVEGLSNTKLRKALSAYVRMFKYYACLTAGAQRVDLLGNPAGLVTEEEAQYAATQISELKAKRKANGHKPQAKRKATHRPTSTKPAHHASAAKKEQHKPTQKVPERSFNDKLQQLIDKNKAH